MNPESPRQEPYIWTQEEMNKAVPVPMPTVIAPTAVQEAVCVEAQDEHGDWISTQEGVNGVGIGLSPSGTICLKIYTNGISDETKAKISKRVCGKGEHQCPVDFEEIGPIYARPAVGPAI
jgi:hypothetical protein